MAKKLRNFSWIIVLIAGSFPIGYGYLVVYDKMLVYSEKMMNFIIGGIGLIFVFSIFCFLIYKVLKWRKIGKDPAKIALVVYTVLLVILALMSLPYYVSEVERRELIEWLSLMPIPAE